MTTFAATSEWLARPVDVAADHPAFAGHFPGRPVWPGVALVAVVLEAARAEPVLAERLGESPAIDVVKFLAPVLPGTRLEIRFRLTAGGLQFSVADGDHVAANGKLSAARPAARPTP